ncbi:hypothetical protein V1478_004357 [Vespula squamosa]|uniref:Uncharacterized protein n=1 Tax=Vespula squamosa TaxID=30214 RepID=A0ABD2BH77_VESSQ
MENRESELVSPYCSQAINKRTLVREMSETLLNKINSIRKTPSVIKKFEESLEEKDNVECSMDCTSRQND